MKRGGLLLAAACFLLPGCSTMRANLREYSIAELCDFTNGFAFKSTDYVSYARETIEVLRMGYIERGGGFKEDTSPVFIPANYKKNLDKFKLRDGDIVIAMTDEKQCRYIGEHSAD